MAGQDPASDEEARRERRRAVARAWRERNPDRAREIQKAWREQNPERARELNRESMRRRSAAAKNLAFARAKARDRARTRREADPEGTRAYQRQWRAANPDKVRTYSRKYVETHRDVLRERATTYRDRNPDAVRRRLQKWHERNPDYAANYQHAYRQDPAVYAKALQTNRDAKRMARRLRQLALPPKQVHRTTAADRRANQRDADHFFTSPLVREHYKQYEAFEFALGSHVWRHGDELRARAQTHLDGRARAGLPTQPLQDAVFVQAIWDVVARGIPCDTLTPDDLKRAVAAVTETHDRQRREQRFRKIVDTVSRHAARNAARLREEAALENRARALAGKRPVRMDVLAHHIAFEDVRSHLTLEGLAPTDIAKAVNLARETHPVLFDDARTGPCVRVSEAATSMTR